MTDFLSRIPHIPVSVIFGAFLLNAGRYVLCASLVSAWVYFGKRRPLRKGWRDLIVEISLSLIGCGIFTLAYVAALIFNSFGLDHFYWKIGDYGVPYFLFTLALLIAVVDANFYVVHRGLHYIGLRSTHFVHHDVDPPSPWGLLSLSALEVSLLVLPFLTVHLIIPVHPLAIQIVLFLAFAHSAIEHSGVELYPANWSGLPFFRNICTVTHHSIHHETGRYHYGFFFTFLDRWLGTEHPDYEGIFRKRAGSG